MLNEKTTRFQLAEHRTDRRTERLEVGVFEAQERGESVPEARERRVTQGSGGPARGAIGDYLFGALSCLVSLLLCSSAAWAESADTAAEPEMTAAGDTAPVDAAATAEAPLLSEPEPEPEPPPAPWNREETVEEPALEVESTEPPVSRPPQPSEEPAPEPLAGLEVTSVVETSPRNWHINILGEATPMFVQDASFDALQRDDSIALAGATIEGGYAIGDQIPIMAQISYGWMSLGDPLFDDLQPTLEAHSVQIGVLAGYRFWDAMMPYVRAGVTLTWAELILDGVGDSFEEQDFAPGVYAMAGLELALARRWIRRLFRTDQFTLGVRVEAGYTYLGRFEYGGTSDDSTLVTHSNSSLGTLRLDGATMRVGFLISF